jgi:hypothetical protein
MATVLQGRFDPGMRAVVTGRRPLFYVGGADAALDRPAHVRAGSAVARVGDRLAVVQDDANFVALADPSTGLCDAIALPDEDGVRLFDDLRGNKSRKLDLEACIAGDDDGGWLIAFGSGSTHVRERLVHLTDIDGERAVRVFDAAALYARLRAWPEFAGSELNLEGAALVRTVDGVVLRLFQRGNGAARQGIAPVDATCDLDSDAFFAWLDGSGPVPEPVDAVQYELGSIAGVRLTFGDAANGPRGLLFLASAEDSPDAITDGPVAGLVLGRVDDDDAPWTPIVDTRGRPVLDKAEGLAVDPKRPGLAWLVIDRDEPETPSELLTLALEGF